MHGAEEKFKEASNAYSILSDDDQRQRYDRFGMEACLASGKKAHELVPVIPVC